MRALFAVVLLLLPGTALAEDLRIFASQDEVAISSNFNGIDIGLFGAIRRDRATVARAADYDVVVTVAGPPADLVVRRKDEILQLWINRASEVFRSVPSYFATLSNRPVRDITNDAVRERFGLGSDRVVLDRSAAGDAGPEEVELFRSALVRLRRSEGLYVDEPRAIAYPMEGILQARLHLPADTPDGLYTVRAYLFAGGVLLATDVASFEVVKTGIEELAFDVSRQQPLLYGIVAVVLSVMVGWIGGVVFRRD
ncbi:MAG: TIGR02186 family protein [Hyphomicrobiaceae bacterium]|nr:TIGR02186 family protein [Hyphomicrobiaceae bacterium]